MGTRATQRDGSAPAFSTRPHATQPALTWRALVNDDLVVPSTAATRGCTGHLIRRYSPRPSPHEVLRLSGPPHEGTNRPSGGAACCRRAAALHVRSVCLRLCLWSVCYPPPPSSPHCQWRVVLLPLPFASALFARQALLCYFSSPLWGFCRLCVLHGPCSISYFVLRR
jgi:hypothetical protein